MCGIVNGTGGGCVHSLRVRGAWPATRYSEVRSKWYRGSVEAELRFCRLQSDQRQLRGAENAHGHFDGTDAAVDIKLHRTDVEMTVYEAPASLGEHGPWSSDEGEANLAAVGVAGGPGIHSAMLHYVSSIVGLMGEQDDGFVRRSLVRHGIVQVGSVL